MLSRTKEIFYAEKVVYEEALKKSGHKVKLEYKPPGELKPKKRVKKHVTWFNPPFSKNVATNIGAKFLQLVDVHFPRGSTLHKVCNRNTLKVSYSTTKNMKKHIASHNPKVLKEHQEQKEALTAARKGQKVQKKLCNCRKPEDCPVEGRCLEESLVYDANVHSKYGTKTYHGLTERSFKQRYTEHKQSIPLLLVILSLIFLEIQP